MSVLRCKPYSLKSRKANNKDPWEVKITMQSVFCWFLNFFSQENCETPRFQNSSSYDDLTRFSLRGINLKLSQRQGQDHQNKASEIPKSQICSSHSITPQINNELRPCPKCTSPSTISKSHNGHFQCQKCGLRFCPTCLRYAEQHQKSKKCYGLSTAQSEQLGPRKCGKDIVGHKKTRDRLRRLWWKFHSLILLLNSQPQIMHFAHSDCFTQSWLSAHIP